MPKGKTNNNNINWGYCKRCGRKYPIQRKTSKYCSDKCRVVAWQDLKK